MEIKFNRINMNVENNKIAKIKIKPLRYTLMELREMNYLKRKGKKIPVELLNKPFEDFDVGNQLKPKKSNKSLSNLKIEEVNENNKESSNLSITPKENDKEEIDNQSKKSSSKESGLFKLNFCNDNNSEDEDNKSSV